MKMRIALRAEGIWWNAYLAREGTMEGARLLGSILLNPAKENEEIKRQFIELMKTVMNDAIKQVGEKTPDWWEERPAPESERSGKA